MIVLFTEKSDVGQAMLSGHPEKADSLLQQWQNHICRRVYFAIKRTQRANEDRLSSKPFACQMPFDVPIIAHNDVRF